LLIRPRIVRSPVDIRFGTRPSQAANQRNDDADEVADSEKAIHRPAGADLIMPAEQAEAGALFGPLLGAAIWLSLRDFLQGALGLGATWF
jgi:hypothetical protein